MGDLFFLSIQCTHEPLHVGPLGMCVFVVVQFCPLFKFFFPLFWGMVMHSNQLKTKANKNYTKGKTDYFLHISTLRVSAYSRLGTYYIFTISASVVCFFCNKAIYGSNKT